MKLFPEHPAELELKDDTDERMAGLQPETLDEIRDWQLYLEERRHLNDLPLGRHMRSSTRASAPTSPSSGRTHPSKD